MKIYLLIDYKGHHSSKFDAVPYKSGMDLDKIIELLQSGRHEVRRVSAPELVKKTFDKNDAVVLTSSEEPGMEYKYFIDDITCFLQEAHCVVYPPPSLLFSNNNKSLMTMMSESLFHESSLRIPAEVVGCQSELEDYLGRSDVEFPVVVKLPSGAMSKNVFKADTASQLRSIYRKNAVKTPFLERMRELIRARKYPGYRVNDRFTGRLVIQEFIPDLACDYKVLKFGSRFFILRRNVRANDFRASGSGLAEFGSQCEVPDGIFIATNSVAAKLKTNMLSVDFALYKNQLRLIEYQGIHFGTLGHLRADIHYEEVGGDFIKRNGKPELEEIYVDCIMTYLEHANSAGVDLGGTAC